MVIKFRDVNWEKCRKTLHPGGILCCATLVLNEPATKGKLHLKKKTFSLLELGNIKLKGHRDIKIQFFLTSKKWIKGEEVVGLSIQMVFWKKQCGLKSSTAF